MTIANQSAERSPSIVFDVNNPNWHTDKDANLLFLRGVQTYMSHLLMVRGHVLLNDVLDALGAGRTTRGCVEGWLHEDGHRIEFTVAPMSTNTYTISFNTQGDIHERI